MRIYKSRARRWAISIIAVSLSLGLLLQCDRPDPLTETFFGKDASTVLVVAHRAAHNNVPENSLEAIEQAVKLGVDIVEIDVRITSDSVPVIMHDGTVDRTTNGSGQVAIFSFKEIRKLKLKYSDGRLSESIVPTLDEVLRSAKGRVLVDIDLKLTEIEPVVEVVKAAGMTREVFFFDSDYEVLSRIAAIDKNLYLMPRTHSLDEVKECIRLFNPPIVHIDPSFYSKDVSDYIMANKARVWINTLGDFDDMLMLDNGATLLDGFLEAGANVLQTDEPEALLEILRAKKLHTN
jgi:glycerophosphoryl diester phosphodiesterase